MDSRSFSLIEAQTLQSLLRELKKIAFENSDVISTVENNADCLIEFKDRKTIVIKEGAKQIPFSFSVKRMFLYGNNKVLFDVVRSPQSEIKKETGVRSFLECDAAIAYFKDWIKILKAYNLISFTEEDYINKFYEDEFFQEYKIIDKDADIQPFSSAQQEKLNSFLIELKTSLENHQEEEGVSEIIEAIDELKKELPVSTKAKAVKHLAKIVAKIKMKGVEFVNDVLYDIAKDGGKIAVLYLLQEALHQIH